MGSPEKCDISQQKCVPCEGGVEPLTTEQAQALLDNLPGWEFTKEGKAIRRRFKFKNFSGALKFVNSVGVEAEKEGHHPDIKLGWGYAEFVMSTHSIGGLHGNDFIMANKINALFDAI
jgi:4a-hydroxytetrahydrobiopterin dehydratase